MAPENSITIEVVYALPHEQHAFALAVPPGTTALEAVRLSGLAARYSELTAEDLRLGIYGRVVAANTVLNDGDRVEIYRPLLADPKHARRKRASTAKKS
jgi:uncharacterized protein